MSELVTVDVAQGTLRGRKASSKSGGTYYSFQGIPYAKPPVGPLRFKVAEPPEPWKGVRDALEEGSSCTQFNPETRQFEGSEDCLYLNVYTKQLTVGTSEDFLMPVMVWIHGGGFNYGSGSTVNYGPDYLVDEEVVVVTINYRLGIFGFLCLSHPVAPGNMGLKDQVAALRWVQKNIIKFGGDSNNVTLFGESAGGASVHYHMLSPMSKGLFSRAISQSGVPTNPWAMKRHPREGAFRTAEALGFTGSKPEELIEFLQGIDHMKLIRTVYETATEEEKLRIAGRRFLPAPEIETEGVEKFLPGSPAELLENGHYNAVPLLAGINEKEGLATVYGGKLNEAETLEKIDRNFGKVILPALHLPKNYCDGDKVASKVKRFFFGSKPVNKDTLDELSDEQAIKTISVIFSACN